MAPGERGRGDRPLELGSVPDRREGMRDPKKIDDPTIRKGPLRDPPSREPPRGDPPGGPPRRDPPADPDRPKEIDDPRAPGQPERVKVEARAHDVHRSGAR